MDFFYDGQTRRYLLQFIRAFSDYKIETGPDENGTKVQTRVPIVYGDMSWMVAQILKGQSENTLMPAPMMSAWISSIDMAPERRQDPTFESKVNAIERHFENGEYTEKIGNRYTIERYMPVPYNMVMQLDIWTTNTTTKLQLTEQIDAIFNPAVQLQQNDNKFDWTSIFEIEMIQKQWTNRTIPQGSEMERDVTSYQFMVPIWINPPAKVRRIKIIEQIVTNIHEMSVIPDDAIETGLDCIGNQIDQIIVTPGDHRIGVGIDGLANNGIILLNKYGLADPTLSWKTLFDVYGNIEDYETILRLKLDQDIEVDDFDILGTVTLDPNKANILTFTVDIDTLPNTTVGGPVDNIIDPHKDLPGSTLPAAVAGQRYLLISDYTDGEEPAVPFAPLGPWGSLIANENDIIEYNGVDWIVTFDSLNEDANQYVINLNTMNHYRFTGEDWIFTYLGEYFPGYWRMENLNADGEWSEGGGGNPFPVCPDC